MKTQVKVEIKNEKMVETINEQFEYIYYQIKQWISIYVSKYQ